VTPRFARSCRKLGNVGFHAAKFLSEEDDARIVAVIERDGVVTNAKGIDVE
jgi:glutamate dehydrogenase (NAD(P)+)